MARVGQHWRDAHRVPSRTLGQIQTSLRSPAVIVPEQSAESLAAFDVAGGAADLATWRNEAIVEALVITLPVVMLQELTDSVAKRLLAEEDQAVETLFTDRPHESLEMRIHVRGARWKPYWLNASSFQAAAKSIAEFAVAIHQQIAAVLEKAILSIGQIPGDLFHPCFVRIGGATGKANAPAGQLHYEKQIEGHQPTLGPNFNRREVDRSEHVPVSLEKRFPTGVPRPLGRWLDAVGFQDVAHRLVRDLLAQISQGRMVKQLKRARSPMEFEDYVGLRQVISAEAGGRDYGRQ